MLKLFNKIDGWMIFNFTSFSAVFQSYHDDAADDHERLSTMEPCLPLRRFRLKRGSNSGPLDH